jgi:hypothetical protein
VGGVDQSGNGDTQEVARRVVSDLGMASAAIFVVQRGSDGLVLTAAAGVEGPALERLIEAVRDPAHPISRSVRDDGPTFDLRPVNPGGPALRSHLPLVRQVDGRRDVVGVLAVAHEDALMADDRVELEKLAAAAAESIVRNGVAESAT